MRHFLDPDWVAMNVMRVAVDPAIVDSFADLAAGPVGEGYHVERPGWNSDISWISAAAQAPFARFEEAFLALDIARHVRDYVAVDREIRLYQGFVVRRSECREAHFHVDWVETGNQAFTMLAPIGEMEPGFGLSFKTLKGEIRNYDYRTGEAVIFGDQFVHSTQPGKAPRETALLCFNFGTDRMEDWPAIARTAAAQGGIVRRPDGTFSRRT